MSEDIKLKTKIDPEIFKLIMRDMIKAIEGNYEMRSTYKFGDGDLDIRVKFKKAKKKNSHNEFI